MSFCRFLPVLFLVFLAQLAQAQQAPRYQYMHIYFTSGLQLEQNAPAVIFSPPLHGQKDVRVKAPQNRPPSNDIPRNKLINSNGEAWVQGADGKERRQTPEEAQLEQKAKARGQQQFLDDIAEWGERNNEALAQALNKAGADGWEVVQMTSPNAGRMVYLLRKPL